MPCAFLPITRFTLPEGRKGASARGEIPTNGRLMKAFRGGDRQGATALATVASIPCMAGDGPTSRRRQGTRRVRKVPSRIYGLVFGCVSSPIRKMPEHGFRRTALRFSVYPGCWVEAESGLVSATNRTEDESWDSENCSNNTSGIRRASRKSVAARQRGFNARVRQFTH